MKKALLFLILTTFLFCIQLNAADFITSNASTTNWNASTTWVFSGADADGIPDADDKVTIFLNHTIVLDIAPIIFSLTMSNGTISGANALTIVDNLKLDAGTFVPISATIGGNLTVNGGTFAPENVSIVGNLTWGGGTIGSATSPTVTDIILNGLTTINTFGASLTKRKLILNGGGSLTLAGITLNEGSIFEIPLGQTFIMNSSGLATFTNGSGSGNTFNVKGTLTLQAGSLTSLVVLNNTGTINITDVGSVCRIQNGGLSSGTFNSNAPTGIIFAGGTHTLSTGATFSGSGNIDIQGDVNVTVPSFSSTVGGLIIRSNTFSSVGTINHSGNLTVQSGTFAPEGAATIGGNLAWTSNGSIGVSTSTSVTDVTIAGAATINGNISRNLVKRKLVLNGGGTWTLGSISVSEGGIFEIGAGTLNYNSSGGYTITDGGGSGNAFNVKGTLTAQTSGLTIGIPVNNTGTINVSGGNLTINGLYSGVGTISVSASRQLFIGNVAGLNYGNTTLTNNGTISSNLLIFNGTTQQTLSGTGSIANLTLNNANGLIISGAQTITTALTLTDGKIQLSNNDLSLGTATLTGGSASSYIQTIGTGNVKRTVGTTDILFPIGETNFTPITIKQASGTDIYAVRVSDGIDPTHPLQGTQYVAKEWNISRTPSNVTAATVKAEWNAPADEGAGFTCASAQLLHYNGTIWEALSTAGTTISCAASPSVRSLTRTNVTSFSPFAVGLPSVVLSVELIDFQAVKHNSNLDLLWQTGAEKDMSHFEIEQSTDGKNYSKIGQTKAAGKANNYIFTPEGSLSILTYFRLKIAHTDGSFTYSKVVSVSFGKNLTVKAFPNPVNNELTIDAFSDAKSLDFEVVDVIGRSVFYKKEQNTEGSKSLTINTLGWSSGIYMLKVTDGKNVFQQKIVKR
jgi:Secretion system C-terminal sorting domain